MARRTVPMRPFHHAQLAVGIPARVSSVAESLRSAPVRCYAAKWLWHETGALARAAAGALAGAAAGAAVMGTPAAVTAAMGVAGVLGVAGVASPAASVVVTSLAPPLPVL